MKDEKVGLFPLKLAQQCPESLLGYVADSTRPYLVLSLGERFA
jgi:hypothetical protein